MEHSLGPGKTKPIERSLRCEVQNKANFGRRAAEEQVRSYKQSQFAHCRFRIADWRQRILRNKPNLECPAAIRGALVNKQTQFPVRRVPPRTLGCAKRTQFPATPGGTGSGRRGTWGNRATSPRCPASGNKANWGRSFTCQDGQGRGRGFTLHTFHFKLGRRPLLAKQADVR
jgi:hypothetical protein